MRMTVGIKLDSRAALGVAANWELAICGCLQGLGEQRMMMQKVAGKENPADALIITSLLNCVIRSEK